MASSLEEFVLADDGTRLFVRSRSEVSAPAGLTSFLNDGILCDGFIWKYLYEQLAERMRVVHWNYRGHGRSGSPVDGDRVGIASLAEDLSAVRKHVGDPPAVLFGHSMGCQVALEGWHSGRKNVRGIVLLCGSFGNVTSTFRGLPVLDMVLPKLTKIATESPHLMRALWTRVPVDFALKMALRLGEINGDYVQPADFRPYFEHMKGVDFPLFLKMLRSAGEHSAGGYLGEIDVPVLIITGDRDTFTPPFLSRAMAEAIPDSELVVVERGTHVAPIELPALVWEKVSAFLDRVEKRAP